MDIEPNTINKKIYMLVKLKDIISFQKRDISSKIQLCSNQGTKITTKQVNIIRKYILVQFTLTKASENQTYYIRFTDESSKQYHSDQITAKDYDEQINFVVEELPYQLKSKEPSANCNEIKQTCLTQKMLMICILGKQNIFKDLFSWLERKPNIKTNLIQEINNCQYHHSFKSVKKICKQKKSKQNIIPYVFANIYAFRMQSFSLQKQGYIQKYFLYQITYNQIQPIPLLKEHENTLRRNILQIYYIYAEKKQYFKVSELFNGLLRDSQNIDFLMRIVYDSKVSNRKNKLANIDHNKLKNIINGLKNQVPIIIYLYYFLLYLDVINNSKILTFNYIIQQIAQLDFQHDEIGVIKDEQYYTYVCILLLNYFYRESNFNFNSRDDFVRFYLKCERLPIKYKNIFLNQALRQKVISFVKASMQIKSKESLQLLGVIFLQCQTSEILYPQQFQGFLIDFFYTNVWVRSQSWFGYGQNKNVLDKLDLNLLEFFVEQVIIQFYIKKKYSNDDKLRVLNQLIKELNLFSFEEIFTIIDKGILQLNILNKQHALLIEHLFSNILKNQILKQPNLYKNLIQKKEWLFFFKLASYSRQYLIQTLIAQAKKLDEQNKNVDNFNMIKDTVLNASHLTQEQKYQITDLIFIIKNENSEKIAALKNILFNQPDQALIYIRCLDRNLLNLIDIKYEITVCIFQIKKSLEEKKLNYNSLKRIYEYDELVWQKLSKLFDCVGEKTLRVIIQQLFTQCETFFNDLKIITNISMLFEFKICQNIKLEAINTHSDFMDMEKNLDFKLNQVLQPFRKLKPEVNQYIYIKYFRSIVLDKEPNDATQFVTILNQSVKLFVQNINMICSKYGKKQLKFNDLRKIINIQDNKDIQDIFKRNTDMNDQHIDELIYVIDKITQLDEICVIYQNLVNILNYIKQGKINIGQLRYIFDKYKQQKYDEIEVHEIYKNIQIVQKLLNKGQLQFNVKPKNQQMEQYKQKIHNYIEQNLCLKSKLTEINLKIQKFNKQNQYLQNKLTEANLMIQRCNNQIVELQNQIVIKQRDFENCKVKLQESTKRINKMEMEIEKCYEIHKNLQREKIAIITKHKKQIEALRTIINNISRYQKLSYVKAGGQAQIYICEDKEEQQIQKKKKILRVCSLEQKFKCLDFEKTLKQPQILSGLDHPNIIKIEKYWEFQSYFKQSRKPIHSVSMILEYIEEGDLSAYIGKLNKFQIKNIYKDIQSALTYLHSKNIIHRDIASKNILLKNVDKPSITITAILTDLGISTILSSYNDSPYITEKYVASNYYTPPQFGQNGIVTVKNDLWSLGVVMLQMTLGKMIYELRPSKTKKYLADYEDFPIKQLQMLKKHTQNYIFADIISMLMKKNPSQRMMIDL